MKLIYVNPANRGYRQLYIHLSWQFLLFVVAVNVFALIYQVLEREQEEGSSTDFHHEELRKRELIANFSVQYNINKSELKQLLNEVKNENDNENKTVTYMDGLLVTLSIFYTIGWGHVIPKTTQGKIFAILSSCIGIPITFLMVVTAAKLLIRQMQDLVSCFSCGGGRCKESNNAVVRKQVLPYLVILFLVFMQVSAGLIMVIEDFSYVDSLYYSFITLTTVGFGDFTQEKMRREESMLTKAGLTLFMFFWILFGVIVVTANILMIFSAKLKSRDVISIRYIRNIRREGDNISIDTELDDGTEMKTFSIMKGREGELRTNLRYLFT